MSRQVFSLQKKKKKYDYKIIINYKKKKVMKNCLELWATIHLRDIKVNLV